jgi:hypothetical protein
VVNIGLILPTSTMNKSLCGYLAIEHSLPGSILSKFGEDAEVWLI